MVRLLFVVSAVLAVLPGAWGQTVDVDSLLERLTLEQKVGQMHIIGYKGRELTPEMKKLIDDWCLGGFFFQIGDNFDDPRMCASLVNSLQKAALSSPAGIPLLTCMDQEGGVGVQIRYEQGAVPTPGNMALGASGREQDAYAAYNALGTDMRACGVNVNFAPAIDVLYRPKNPDYTVRLFSGDIHLNAVMARGAVRGLQDANIIACAKHWPGLVYYEQDTHFAAPHVTESDQELRKGDFAHFRAAIEAGTDMIMSHMIYVDAWDPENIVTTSPKLIDGILRGELGYDRLIVTDSMSMESITSIFDHGEAAARSVVAGCDLVLQVARDVEQLRERIDGVLKAVNDGEISEDRIDESVRRILKAKAKYNLFENPYADLENFDKNFGRADLVAANKRAALNGVVLVRDDAKLLPLARTGKKICVISPPDVIIRPGKPPGWDVPIGGTLGGFVQTVVPDAVEVQVNTVPTEAAIAEALSKAEAADIVIGYSLLARQSPKQVAFLKKLLGLGKPTVIVGLGDPSDMEFFTEMQTFVAANSPAPISMGAAVSVIFGDAKPGGRLPMLIGDLYPIGYALALER